MRALITGVEGFVGKYLVEELLSQGMEIIGTVLIKDGRINTFRHDVTVIELDILCKEQVCAVVSLYKPDFIIHLAGQSSVQLSWNMPAVTFEINTVGTINLLEAVKEYSRQSKVLLIGSSEQYGIVPRNVLRISENTPINPLNPYAISKQSQEAIAQLYVATFDLNIVLVRAFNHIGPGQSKGFVVPDFASKIAEIECGVSEPVIQTGNLAAVRDFSDVRDVVVAYSRLLQKGERGQVYNVGSGTAVSIHDILTILLSFSSVSIEVLLDSSKLRPLENPCIVCDNSKLISTCNFISHHTLQDALLSVLSYYRLQSKKV